MKPYKLILSFTLFIQSTAFAQTPDSLNCYLSYAAENNPGVKAAFSLYKASLQKIPQAGAWQDPTLDVGIFFKPMELVDGRQIADFRLMQMFPWFGTRKAARTEAQRSAQMAFEEFRNARDQLFLDVYTQWFTLCKLQQQLKNNRENRDLLAKLEELALQKFASGGNTSASGERKSEKSENNNSSQSNSMSGMSMSASKNNSQFSILNWLPPNAVSQFSQMGGMGTMEGSASSGMSDILRIQMEMAETDANMESLLSEIAAEKARFNALLNRASESQVALPDTLLQIPYLFDFEEARALVASQNPMLAMLEEEEQMYVAQAEMQKKMSYPMFGIGLEYMLIAPKTSSASEMNAMTGSSSMSSMNGKDMLMPMISVTLPIWRGKYKAQQRETALRQQSASERRQNEQNLLEAELYRAKRRLDEAGRRIALYRRQSELAQTAYSLVISEFSTGKGDLANVIQVQRQLIDYELKIAEATADYNTAVAELQKLVAGFGEEWQ